jgi:hypothetical protein
VYKTKNSLAMAIALSIVLFVCGSIGIAFAQDGTNPQQDMQARVAKILGIDQTKLAAAFKQAQAELQAEMLAKLVKEGKITQQQADQLKAWEAAKPDPKTDPQKFEAWLKAKPDVPLPKPEGPPPGGFPHGFPPDFPMQVPPPPTP